MKIQVRFYYKKEYQFTIDENDIDMTHYDEIWDYWVGENDNELNDKFYVDKDEENERVFEISAKKHFFDDGKECISGDGLYVNIYANNNEDETENVVNPNEIPEILYA